MSDEDAGMTATADSGMDSSSTQTSDPSASTAMDQGTAQPGTPSPDTAQTSLPSDTSAFTPPAQPPQAASPAVKPPATSVPTEPNWQEQATVAQKRMNDALAHATRLYQEKQQLEQRYQPFANHDPQKVREAMEFQARAQSLKPWNPRHPEYQNNGPRITAAETYLATLRSLSPEQQSAQASSMAQAAGITADDIKLAVDKERHVKNEVQNFARDPETYIHSRVDSLINDKLNQFEQYQRARGEAQARLTDPTNQPIIQQFAPQMAQMMDPNISAADKAFAYGQALAQVQALQAQISGKVQQAATAEAQQHARRGKTAQTRPEVQQNRIEDPYDYLTKKGFKPGTQEMAAELLRLNSGG